MIRRQARESGDPNVLMEGCRALAPRVLPYSRRAARLLERIGLERPSLKLSGLLAGAQRRRSQRHPRRSSSTSSPTPWARCSRAAAPRRPPSLPPPLARLAAALDDLERRTIAEGARTTPPGRGRCDRRRAARRRRAPHARREPARVLLRRGPRVRRRARWARRHAGRARPERAARVRAGARLHARRARAAYAIERMRDVVFEPIGDEGARLVTCWPRARWCASHCCPAAV